MRIVLARRVLWGALLLLLIMVVGFLLRPVSYFNAMIYLKEDLSGVESRYVRVDGYRVHYLVEGPAAGPVVVLVHGLGSRAEDWLNISPYLVHAGFRVYMPDLLGYGRSERPRNFSYSVHAEAAVVARFNQALQLRHVDLGGWSMGGWIVQLLAIERPDRVNRLMLFDAAGLDVKPDWNTGLFTPANTTELDELDALLMPHPQPIPGYVAADLLHRFHEQAWIINRAMASMLTAQDVTDALLPQLKMPVLIEWGGLDKITPVAQAETIHQLIPQSKLDVYDGCGHLAPLQCAAQMGPNVERFLER
jgi:pimeloyl-ACP methyl ester carboxylesterase